MKKRYEYLETLCCFDKLKEQVPDMLDSLEKEMKWYEEEATDEDIGDGEHLSPFLACIYGDGEIDDWLEEFAL